MTNSEERYLQHLSDLEESSKDFKSEYGEGYKDAIQILKDLFNLTFQLTPKVLNKEEGK